MSFPNERDHMMLAKGVDLDIFDNHHLPVVFPESGGREDLFGIEVITLVHKQYRFGNPSWCLYKPFTVRIFPDELQDLFIVITQLLNPVLIKVFCLLVCQFFFQGF